MKTFLVLCSAVLALAGSGFGQQWLDRVDDALTVHTPDGGARARLSGLFDAEGYYFEHPAPGLIDTSRHTLPNTRLTLLLDAQAGPMFYFFAQSRLDRGFDPQDRGGPRLRLDEYALRVTPWRDGRLSMQIGKASTVFGAWPERHLSWDNPFVNAPLAYENVTAASDKEPPDSGGRLERLGRAEKYDHLPVIWGPDYGTGLSVSGRVGKFDYAAEIKNTPLAARPESWDVTEIGFDRLAFGARLGYRPGFAWNIGISASGGAYLRTEAGAELPAGDGIGDYHEIVIGQDVSYSAGHWQIWAELIESRFELPRAGDLDAFSYYVEAKYKFTLRLFGALRWNEQFFSDDTGGASQRDTRRLDASLGYRLTEHTQLKLQYSLQFGGSPIGEGSTLAGQFTVRF